MRMPAPMIEQWLGGCVRVCALLALIALAVLLAWTVLRRRRRDRRDPFDAFADAAALGAFDGAERAAASLLRQNDRS
jgi:hypothetical protein